MSHKVVILSTSLGLGGADRQIILLSDVLLERGYDVKDISMTPLGAMGIKALEEGMPVQSLNMKRGFPNPRAVFRLVALLRDHQPEVLVNFMSHAILLGRISGFLAQVPVMISAIRNEKFSNKFFYHCIRLTSWLDDLYTTNSVSVTRKLIESGFTTAARIQTTPNCISSQFQALDLINSDQLRCKLGVSGVDFLWVAVGRLVDQKDYPNLLKAFQELSDSKARLVVAGEGPLKEKLNHLVSDLGLVDQVTFLGPRSDVPALLAAADGFVLSSAWEGLPNVVMEALALGTPVVATRVGGVPELVKDQETGFLVDPKDPTQLSLAMQKLMQLPSEQRQTMGRLGRQYIENHFSPNHIADIWEKLFQDLLAKKNLA